MLISTVVRLAVPIIIGTYIVDQVLPSGDYNLLIQFVIGIAVMYLLSYIGNAVRIKYVNILGQNVVYDLRHHLFSHVQRLSNRFSIIVQQEVSL